MSQYSFVYKITNFVDDSYLLEEKKIFVNVVTAKTVKMVDRMQLLMFTV